MFWQGAWLWDGCGAARGPPWRLRGAGLYVAVVNPQTAGAIGFDQRNVLELAVSKDLAKWCHATPPPPSPPAAEQPMKPIFRPAVAPSVSAQA